MQDQITDLQGQIVDNTELAQIGLEKLIERQ